MRMLIRISNRIIPAVSIHEHYTTSPQNCQITTKTRKSAAAFAAALFDLPCKIFRKGVWTFFLSYGTIEKRAAPSCGAPCHIKRKVPEIDHSGHCPKPRKCDNGRVQTVKTAYLHALYHSIPEKSSPKIRKVASHGRDHKGLLMNQLAEANHATLYLLYQSIPEMSTPKIKKGGSP